MTHPDGAREGDPPPDPLTEAMAAYSAAFSGRGLPFLRILHAGGPEERRAAVELLRHAVARGQPLDGRDVMDALGIRRPPDGPVY